MRDLQHGLVGVGGYVRAVRTCVDRRRVARTRAVQRGQLITVHGRERFGAIRTGMGLTSTVRTMHGSRRGVRDRVFGVSCRIISSTGA